MSQQTVQHAHDPRTRQRSNELLALLARCPEHLFSTDDDEMASIGGTKQAENDAAPASADAALEKAA